MEDILASIRRILAEEDAAPAAAPVATPAAEPVATPAPAPPHFGESVLQLDASMMLPVVPAPAPPPPAPAPAQVAPLTETIPPPDPIAAPAMSLVGAQAAAAAATSVGSLLRTLTAGRTTQVYSGGPTLEDVVRAELRPLLTQWLDTHLPPLVERLVRAEIERVVGRAVP
jgi:cell pole-organizing protein PopZ